MLDLFVSCCDLVIASGLAFAALKCLNAGRIDFRGQVVARRDEHPCLFWSLFATVVVAAALAWLAALWLGLEGFGELVD